MVHTQISKQITKFPREGHRRGNGARILIKGGMQIMS